LGPTFTISSILIILTKMKTPKNIKISNLAFLEASIFRFFSVVLAIENHEFPRKIRIFIDDI